MNPMSQYVPLPGFTPIRTVIDTAQRARIAAGLYISDPSEVAAGLAQGFSVFVLSIDYTLLGAALRSAAGRMREQVR